MVPKHPVPEKVFAYHANFCPAAEIELAPLDRPLDHHSTEIMKNTSPKLTGRKTVFRANIRAE